MKKILYLIACQVILFSAQVQAQKQFVLFDAMHYTGKPDLASDALHPVNLIYQGYLTKPDPNDSSKFILDMDKVNNMAESAAAFPKVMVSTDIEYWYADRKMNGEKMKENFITLFNAFREKNPEVQISNYGVPYSALCLRRYGRENVAEEEILREWRASSAKRIACHEVMDYFCPSVYIGVPGVESWAKDLETTVNEIKTLNSTKKIYVYIWPQYYDFANSPYYKKFIAPSDWKKMLESAFEYCDGVIIWASNTDENKQVVYWSDSRVQAMWNVTKEFIASHKGNIW